MRENLKITASVCKILKHKVKPPSQQAIAKDVFITVQREKKNRGPKSDLLEGKS